MDEGDASEWNSSTFISPILLREKIRQQLEILC